MSCHNCQDCAVCGEVKEEPTRGDLQEALRDTAQATVTALDRLILAEAVCKAANNYRQITTGQHTNGPQYTLALRDTKKALWEALDAWEKGQPS